MAAILSCQGCQKGANVQRLEMEPQIALADSPFDPNTPPKYVLCPADRLMIRFPDDTALDQETCIRSDGMISLPYIDSVRAAQRSPEELSAELTERYASVFKTVAITVVVKEEAGRRVFLGGEVRTPGALTLHGGQTLSQTLFEAGGITAFGRSDQVLVMRIRPGDATYVLSANLDAILAGREPDVRLEPYDIVYVPETVITRINRFVEQYINRMIPTQISFPFTTELYKQPTRIVGNTGSNFTPVTVTP